MSIAKLLEQHKVTFEKAKDELEASLVRLPDRQFPIKLKKKTLEHLRARARAISMTRAKEESVRDFDASIRSINADITRLESEIRGDAVLLAEPRPEER